MKNIKHGLTVGSYKNGKQKHVMPKIYSTWSAMKQRCYNKKHKAYKNYGGRGIKVCDSWLDFQNFYDDMNKAMEDHIECYGKKNTQLERVDNNKGYNKENCIWITPWEQAQNRRNTIRIGGYTLQELKDRFGIRRRTAYSRLKQGWTDKEIIQGDRPYSLNIKKSKVRELVLSSQDSLNRLQKRDRSILRQSLGIGERLTRVSVIAENLGLSEQMIYLIFNNALKTMDIELSTVKRNRFKK